VSRKKRDRGRVKKRRKESPGRRKPLVPILAIASVILAAALYFLLPENDPTLPIRQTGASRPATAAGEDPAAGQGWTDRAVLVSRQFHRVYTPCWEGAYGAVGDARLFSVTGDSSLLRFHSVTHDLRGMCSGTWLDDRAWVCLAELEWWRVTGKTHMGWITDAAARYDEARAEGRLSNHEGYWTWYNWSPSHRVNEPIFTNSNMNQMAAVGCGLYEATGRRRYLEDALMVWNGDGVSEGIEARLYRGGGRWEGRQGRAAFGKELPWGGLAYASIGASLFRATGEPKYREIAVATVRRILDPATGWVDPVSFYQLRMDGNGNFVQFLLDAWEIAPVELADVPAKIEKMLEHVWSNDNGTARVVLHRAADHGIRNGWNPRGGEDGYGVDEVGTVHAQGEAMKAFGMFAAVDDRIRREAASALTDTAGLLTP
jgi:hypothetical protein